MSDAFVPKISEKFIKKYHEKFAKKFVVQNMDLIHWVPTYRLVGTSHLKNGKTIYHLRSDSEKTLFINALYWALHNFMLYLGFDPENPFLYIRPNPRRITNKHYSPYLEKVYDRLVTYNRVMRYNEFTRKFVFVRANFFSNDIEKDLGFYIRCCSRTVDLVVFPHAKLNDLEGNEVKPEIFIHLLLLNMQYPLYIYYYNKVNGTLTRLIREYPHLINQTHHYRKWSF